MLLNLVFKFYILKYYLISNVIKFYSILRYYKTASIVQIIDLKFILIINKTSLLLSFLLATLIINILE